MASENGILTERIGKALKVTLSNPGKKNAISKAMYLGLTEALKNAAADPSIRAIWLTGADGDFTSGNLVEDFADTVQGENSPVVQFLHAIITCPKPIVAEVSGVAIGVGATMLMHCDLVYAAEATRMRLPFVNLGLVPEAGSSYILPRLMGQAKAAELLLLGKMFDAAEGEALGLVTRCLPKEALQDAAREAVDALCAQPPQALQTTKALLRKPLSGDLLARVEDEIARFGAALEGAEFKEAFTAFVEKRPPVFD